MLRCKEGMVAISGNITEIMLDLTSIIRSEKKMLTEHFGEEFADKVIKFCGELAYMTEEEVEANAEQIAGEMDQMAEVAGYETNDGELAN